MALNGRLARLHAHLSRSSDDATASMARVAAEADADPLEMTPTEKFMFDLQGYLVRAHTAGRSLSFAALVAPRSPRSNVEHRWWRTS